MVNDSYEDAYDMIMEALKLVKKSIDEVMDKKASLYLWQIKKHLDLSADLAFLYGKHHGLYEIADKILHKREALLNAKEKTWKTPQQ